MLIRVQQPMWLGWGKDRSPRGFRRGTNVVLLGAALAVAPVMGREVPFAAPVDAGAALQMFDVVAADFDGDGDLDLATVSEQEQRVIWQWDSGSGWLQATVVDTLAQPRGIAAADMDCDGEIDLVIGESGTDSLLWYRNDGQALSWSLGGTITTAAPDLGHFIAVDITRDGAVDVIGASTSTGNVSLWRKMGGCASSTWTVDTVAASVGLVANLVAADLDGDGWQDIALSEVDSARVSWWRSPAGPGSWTGQVVQAFIPGVLSVTAGDVDGDGDNDLAAVINTTGEIIWWANDGGGASWTESPIATLAGVKLARLADVDGDGDVDLAAASTPGGGELAWWDNLLGDGSAWTRHSVDAAAGTPQDLLVVDLGADADADLVTAALGAGRIRAYLNDSTARSGTLDPPLFNAFYPFFLREIADLRTADMDGDGDDDLVLVERDVSIPDGFVFWFRNEGVDGDGLLLLTGPNLVHLQTLRSIESVAVGDVDRDGDPDVIAGYTLNVAEHGSFCRNTGGGGWSCSTIIGLGGALLAFDALSLHDIDGDGDLDLLGAVSDPVNDDTVAWWERDGNPAQSSSWTRHDIGVGPAVVDRLDAADLDGDGDLDVVGPRNRWWRQTALGWVAETVAGDAIDRLAVADIDADGDPDLAAATLTVAGPAMAWFENDGSGTFTERSIRAADNVALVVPDVALADLDRDGDPDLIGHIVQAGISRVAWFENRVRTGEGWTERSAGPTGFAGDFLVSSDFDRDGAPDLVLAEDETWLVSWINGGGQFALESESVAPPAIAQGGEAALLAIRVEHRGEPGQAALGLAGLALRFESAPGVPLDDAQLGALVAALRLYRDNGSGVFEPGSDPQVASVAPPLLDAGLGIVAFSPGNPGLQQAPENPPPLYFLTVQLQPGAASAGVPELRVIHDANAGSGAENTIYGTPLLLENALPVTATVGIVEVLEELFVDGFEHDS